LGGYGERVSDTKTGAEVVTGGGGPRPIGSLVERAGWRAAGLVLLSSHVQHVYVQLIAQRRCMLDRG